MDFRQNNSYRQDGGNIDNFTNDFFQLFFNQIRAYSEQIVEFKKELKNSQEKTRELENKIKDLTEKETQTLNNVNEIDANIKNIRDKTIEPLAVFVGLFTFASISFSSLSRDLDSNSWISIILIISGITILFSSLVIYASALTSDKKSRRNWTIVLITISIILVIAGTIMHIINAPNSASITNEPGNSSIDMPESRQ